MNLKTRFAAVTGGIALAVTLVACGDSTEEATPAQDASSETAADPTETEVDDEHNDADTSFAQMMIIHHEGAIEMADLAVDEGATAKVRTLAERIAAAQGPEIEQMTSWLKAWGEPTAPAGGMGGMDHGGMDMGGMDQEGAMTELESLSGTGFDRRFLEIMIEHHRGAVQMAETELEQGENRQARELAQRIIDDQTNEIALMEKMLQNL